MYEIKEWNGFETISEFPPEFEEFTKVNLISIKKPIYIYKLILKDEYIEDSSFNIYDIPKKMEYCVVQEVYFIIPQKHPYKLNSFIKVLKREFNVSHGTKFYTIGYMRVDEKLYGYLESYRLKKYGEYNEDKKDSLYIDEMLD